jgi:hypothetical protein
LLNLPFEELSEKFILAYKRHGRYSSWIKIDDKLIVYGSQTLTGILLDYSSLLEDLLSIQPHEMVIDGFPVADVEVYSEKVCLKIRVDRQGGTKKFLIPEEEYRKSLTHAVQRISFGMYMIDMAEMAVIGRTL